MEPAKPRHSPRCVHASPLRTCTASTGWCSANRSSARVRVKRCSSAKFGRVKNCSTCDTSQNLPRRNQAAGRRCSTLASPVVSEKWTLWERSCKVRRSRRPPAFCVWRLIALLVFYVDCACVVVFTCLLAMRQREDCSCLILPIRTSSAHTAHINVGGQPRRVAPARPAAPDTRCLSPR